MATLTSLSPVRFIRLIVALLLIVGTGATSSLPAMCQDADSDLSAQLLQLQKQVKRLEAAVGNRPDAESAMTMQSNSDSQQATVREQRTPGVPEGMQIKASYQNCLQCHQTRPAGPLPPSHLVALSGSGKSGSQAAGGQQTSGAGMGQMSQGGQSMQGGSGGMGMGGDKKMGMGMMGGGKGMGMGMMGGKKKMGMGMMGGGGMGMGDGKGMGMGMMGGGMNMGDSSQDSQEMSGMSGGSSMNGSESTPIESQVQQMRQQIQQLQQQMQQMMQIQMQMQLIQMKSMQSN
tara:strand:+ start:1444 stop:2307 length:864 start_codon:yes stop_codon:yes gene_type:complete